MDAAGLSDAAMQASIRALVAPADAIFLDAKVEGGRRRYRPDGGASAYLARTTPAHSGA